MTGIDLALLAIIGLSALLGLWRGLVRVLVSLAAWLLGGAASFLFGADVARWFSGAASPQPVHLLAGHGVAFVGVFLAVVGIGWLVRRVLQSIGLSGVDRFLGLAFGVVRGGVIACLLVVVMGFTAAPQQPGWRDSRVLPLLLPVAQWTRAQLPDWSALPIAPADALRNIDLAGANPMQAVSDAPEAGGMDPSWLGSAVLGSSVLRSSVLGSSALDPGATDSSDSSRVDSSGDKPHGSNDGDAFALPQPGG